MQAQRLHPQAVATDAGQLLRDVVAIQAQESRAAALSIRPTTAKLTREDVRIALEETRSIVLTWCMRGTMHLLPASDAGWLLGIFGPVFIKKTNFRYAQLGLYDATRARAKDDIAELLGQRGAVPRPALRDLLARRGYPTEGQAFIHLMRFAALSGIVCFGPRIDGEESFVLLEDWITSRDHPQNPQAELARRYLRAYGPASDADFARWSGLPLTFARHGLAAIPDELDEFEGLSLLKDHAAPPDVSPFVRLLPAFDTLLLGYDSREWLVDAEHAAAIHPGGGIIKPTVLVDGRIVGVWSFQKGGRVIQIEKFGSLTEAVISQIEDEARDIGRFLGADTTLTFA
jgi:hypothetical protein